jgi:ABC-type antimicrobial peptide transport system permease subunit
VVETAGAPLSATNAVRREIAAVDPGVPASFVRSMDQWMDASIAPRRFNLQLVTGFALAALVLAVVGVYAVSASSVAMRSREIGIRTALGASKANVIGLVLRGALAPVALGLFAGGAAAFVSAGAAATLLFGVAPHDPASFAVVAVTLATAATVASYVPARRAGTVDPIVALRAD